MAALTLSSEVYLDKVLGGWQGKSAGVTLGSAQRGQLVPGRFNYYNPVPGQPVASAALDFPLVWLAALEQAGADITPAQLKDAWLQHLDYSQDEFGYAALNLRRGLTPPASGAHSNWFRHATGGIIRADFWAMVAPGNPQLAAAHAYHDTILDHCEDGVWAAMFLAAVGSASFFLTDTVPLLTIGLAMIPRTCRAARAIKTALAAGQRSASWLEAREDVQHEVGSKNYSDAPQNMGFFTIGLIYGQKDFGASLCAATNCGYDAEAVGGALGAILGIQRGKSGLPEDWTRPIGDLLIPGMGMREFTVPLALSQVADRTVTVGKRITRAKSSEIEITELPGIEPFSAASFPTAPLPDLAPSSPEPEPAEGALPEPEPAESPLPPPSPVNFVEFAVPSPEETQGIAFAALNPMAAEPAVPPAEPEPIMEAQPPAYTPPEPLPPAQPAVLTPQPISDALPSPLDAEEPGGSPPSSASASPSLAPDPAGAIAWTDSAMVKPLLVRPPYAFTGQSGPFEIVLDMGESPTLSYGPPRTLSLTIFNRGDEAFTGRIALLVPPGWQAAGPANFGQRQYVAAHTGVLRAEYRIQAVEGQARIDIANAIAVRLTPDSGGAPFETQFVLMGAACWWTVGSFANFDGEGFDRSYLPEDRPGLHENYLGRNLQNIRWEKRAFPESVLDLEPLFRGSSGVCYGQTILRCPGLRDARLIASTNNGVKVWLNGQLVLRRYQRGVFRPSFEDAPWSADVTLRPGDNPVMVKWVRGSEPFQFSLALTDRQGRALPDIGNTTW